jgi:hypothetical protein
LYRILHVFRPSFFESIEKKNEKNLLSNLKENMAIKDKSDTEYFEWTTEEEIQLFSALNGLKPVGINKHFFMACKFY